MLLVYDIHEQSPVPWKLFLFVRTRFFRLGQKIFDELIFFTRKLSTPFTEHLSLSFRVTCATTAFAFFRCFHPPLPLSYNKMDIYDFVHTSSYIYKDNFCV